MRKRWIYIIIIFVLTVLAVVLIVKSTKVNTLDENSNFAVADTGAVTQVFLADKNNNTVLLKKDGQGQWMVNDRYKASSYAINMFLKTIMSVEVKSPVSKQAYDNIVSVLASNSTKVEIYQKAFRINLFGFIKWFSYEKLVKTYYVGMATQNNTGTFMLMEGSTVPFITYIPGFNGFLSSRYSSMEKDWRDHTIFNYHYKDIKSVSLWFPEYPPKSFKVIKNGMKDFGLFRLTGINNIAQQPIAGFDSVKVMEYFSSFENIRYEEIVNNLDKTVVDSILNSTPFHILTIEETNGKIYTLKTFHKRGYTENPETEITPSLWDRDRMYAQINEGADFVLIQFFVFDRIIRPLDYYLPQEKVADENSIK